MAVLHLPDHSHRDMEASEQTFNGHIDHNDQHKKHKNNNQQVLYLLKNHLPGLLRQIGQTYIGARKIIQMALNEMQETRAKYRAASQEKYQEARRRMAEDERGDK